MISEEQERRLTVEAAPLLRDALDLSCRLVIEGGCNFSLEKEADKAYDRFFSCYRAIFGDN